MDIQQLQQVDEPARSALAWARENVLWLLTLIPVGIAVLRVFVVSRGDEATFKALLSNIDFVSLALATMLPQAPVIMFWALVTGAEWYWTTPKSERPEFIQLYGYLIFPPFALLALSFMSLTQLITNVGLLSLFLLIRYLVKKRFSRSAQLQVGGLAMFLPAISVALTSGSMWLPAEMVTISDQPPRQVYVLSTADDWMTYLDSDSGVARVKLDSVTARQICNTRTASVPVISHFRDATPRCPG